MRLANDLIPWLHRGLLVSVACCDYSGAPVLARALALRIESCGESVAVFLHGASAQSLLQQARTEAIVSIVCEQSTTHRSLQIKGPLLGKRALNENDQEWCRRYRQNFIREVGDFGFPQHLAEIFVPEPDAGAVVLECRIVEVYTQTPGANSASPLPNQENRQ